jgi:hypothetical protein
MGRQSPDMDLASIIGKTKLIEELSQARGVSLGEAYVIARGETKPQGLNEMATLDRALSQLIVEKTRHWKGELSTKPGIAHVVGIVGVAEDLKISLAEAAKIAIKENRDNEHWEAIAWAIKFLGQETE